MSMSAADTEAFRAMIEKDPENQKCFECGHPNPQWCDFNHGVFVCIDCSGVHRSLGTHLCAVRSSTMDGWLDWRPDKLKQMQLGGNRNARMFFDARGVPKSPIRARYEHPVAQLYKAKLEAAATGQAFDEASFVPMKLTSPAATPTNATGGGRFQGVGSSGSRPAPSSSAGGGDDWLAALGTTVTSTATASWNTVAAVAADAGRAIEKGAKAVEHTAKEVPLEDIKTKVAVGAQEGAQAVATGAVKAWGWASSFVSSVATQVAQATGSHGPTEEDGLSSLTRNVARSDQQYGSVAHEREDSSDGLRDLASHLPHPGPCNYEGIGGTPVAASSAPAAAARSAAPAQPQQQPSVRSPPAQPKDKKGGWEDDEADWKKNW